MLPENSNARLLQAFMGLQLSAGIAITFTTLTVLLSARVKRHATWISFCISWIISCFSYTLLLFCGHETKHAPAYSLCLFQSVLIYSTPMLAAYTTLALVVHLYFSLRMMLCEDGESTGIHSFWLLSVPYVLCGVMAVIALDLGLAHPESVFRDQFYCRINTGVPGKISSVFVILAGVGIVVYEVLSAKVLYQRWHLFCYTESSQKPSVAFMARIVCFTSFTTIGVCIALIFSLKAKISSSQMHDATNILLALGRLHTVQKDHDLTAASSRSSVLHGRYREGYGGRVVVLADRIRARPGDRFGGPGGVRVAAVIYPREIDYIPLGRKGRFVPGERSVLQAIESLGSSLICEGLV